MPPWRSKGAGGARGSKASAAKRTVKGKQRAAHRRPPARLLAKRRAPKSTIERRAEIAGRNRRLLHGSLAAVGVVALTALSVAFLLDDFGNDGASTLTQAQVAQPEPQQKVTVQPDAPVEASVVAPSIDEPQAPTSEETELASAPVTADSIVAPSAPPPAAADASEEPAAAEVETDPPAVEADEAAAPTAQEPVAETAPTTAASEAIVTAGFEADGVSAAEPPAASDASGPQKPAQELVETQTDQEAEPEPELAKEATVDAEVVEAVPEETGADEVLEIEAAEPVAPQAETTASPATDVAVEPALVGPAETEPAEQSVAETPALTDAERTSLALAADLQPDSPFERLPEPALEPTPEVIARPAVTESAAVEPAVLPAVAKQALAEVDSLAEEVEKVLVEPVRLSELLPEAVQNSMTAVEPDRSVADSAAATPGDVEPDSPAVAHNEPPAEAAAVPAEEVASKVEIDVPPVTETEPLAIEAEVPVPDLEPEPILEDGEPLVAELVPAGEAREPLAEAEAPLVELVETTAEPAAAAAPSILATPRSDDPIPAGPLSSEPAIQMASLTPTRRPTTLQNSSEELESLPRPLRRPAGQYAALVQPEPTAPATTNGTADWQHFAVPTNLGPDRGPMIALVIDDLGLNRPKTWRTIELPAPLTLAFLTYATGLPEMTSAARARGHELIVHMPMEPLNPRENPGRYALITEQTGERVAKRLDWGLSRFEGYVGINNHMGSRFTAWPAGMEVVMREMRRRGLLFLDSLTNYESVGGDLAERFDVPYALRDIFLDNEAENANAIRRQLEKLESIALEKSYAVGIGHPYPETLNVLTEWLPAVRERGFHLVPISAVVRHRSELAATTE